MPKNPLVLIPARLGSRRLPGKPLAEIAGKPMIVHVADRAAESGAGRVVVACDDKSIVDACLAAGHEAVLTRTDHQSGSDRIDEARQIVDPGGKHDIIINVQGDLPTLEPSLIQAALLLMDNPSCDIGTLGVEILNEEEKTNPNIVKIIGTPLSSTVLRALYFSRAMAPWGEGPLFHHIGLYVYRTPVLTAFNAQPVGTLERRESLEQLRALEAGMQIHAAIVDTLPLGVDTQPDLDRARALLGQSG